MLRDDDLVTRALNGDKHAFEELVKKYQRRIYGVAYHILRDFEDAQDLTQEAFLMAYQKLPELKQSEKFAIWLRIITINLCKTWRRSNGNFNQISLDLIIEEDEDQSVHITEAMLSRPDDQYEEIEGQEIYESVRTAINALPEIYRLVATLFFMDDMPYKDIGDFLELPVSTVQSRLQRARNLLKERMITMAQEWFDVHKLPEDFCKKVLAETDSMQVGEMKVTEPRWGKNTISAKLTNKTTRTQWIGMDVRSEVKEERGTNWQTQFIYQVQSQETKTIRESFDINWVIKDFDYYRGEGRCTLRISFASIPENLIDSHKKYTYVLEHPFFSKAYPLKITSDTSAVKKIEPILPQKGNVTLDDVEILQPQIGENRFMATLTNHTDRIQYIRIHIDASGGGYGGGESYKLVPNESQRIQQTYLVYSGFERETGGELVIHVHAVALPENLPELGWNEALSFLYALDYPDAVIHEGITKFNLPPLKS